MKNKFVLAVFAGLTSIAIVGCGSTPEKNQEFADCVYPDDGETEAPLWVCGAPFKNVVVSAVGSHEKTGAGVDFQKSMATASAREQLAAQLRTTVQAKIKRFTETTGAGDTETVDRLNASVAKQITNETLSGSRMYIMRTNPETGMMYVLVGLDAELAKEYSRQALNTSMNNDKALWQQLRAKKSMEELAEDIANLD